ncbi:hypothetical protein SISNIDRAFT_83847 [Sistotremastrum niveocremeum HHB9708]|uniref:Autophagy-related protein 101 n=1 Tax=Sistotremastrum niveocremeum HHB9708 TaxID=1314777 RepID=A0A164URX7_9AGAM|nr:hypothetical protein SISNIDRAFT_83847 [Sistotremastrum niveocremeum HHB9708]
MEGPVQTITIDLTVDRQTYRDVLRAILHSILFHRLFGNITPQVYEVLDVTLVRFLLCMSTNLKLVDAFWRAVEGGPRRGQVSVTFSEKRTKKAFLGFGEVHENVPWEQWVVNTELRQPKSEDDRVMLHATLARKLTAALKTILTYTSSERGRAAVPRISSAVGISPFPFDINARVGGQEV